MEDRVASAPQVHLLLRLIAYGAIASSILSSPTGWGVVVCWQFWLTDVPCPGCGLTRSFSLLTRGMFAESFAMHPFGPAVFLVLVGLAVFSVLPARYRIAAARFKTRGLAAAAIAFVVAFAVFGMSRAAWHGYHLLAG